MRSEPRNVALGVLLVLLVVTFYPSLMLGRRLAPEPHLKGVPPWRLAWGPNPAPPARVLNAATRLGPRLAVIEREGLAAALWDPWIGGGRPGWLSSPSEGGAPLPLLAALAARSEWVWSALVALTLATSFTAAWLAVRWTGASSWAAAAAATAYSLSGPVAACWLDWRGSALALGPLALLPALAPARGWPGRVAAWTLAGAAVLLAGPPAAQFLALAIAYELAGRDDRGVASRVTAVAAALLLVALVRLPVVWLDRAGREPDAPVEAAPAVAPPARLLSFVVPAGPIRGDGGRPLRQVAAEEEPGTSTLLGAAAIVLALAGCGALHGRRRGFWAAVTVVCAALAAAPAAWLDTLGMQQRPFGALALAVAVLAAHGVGAALRRVPERWARQAGAVAVAALVAELAPHALRELPFPPQSEGRLSSPLPVPLADDGSRVATIMSALPPDIAATFGLADVRARRYRGEPAYERLVGTRTAAGAPALDPVLARLGGRWLLEPLPLRKVSAEVFGEVELVEAPLLSPAGGSPARYRVALPPQACRLGLPRGEAGDAAVFLQGPLGTTALEADDALVEESAEWRWLRVDDRSPRGDVIIGLIGQRRTPESLSLAIDASGVRLAGESVGLRVWEWERALPFARLAPPAAGARVRVVERRPARVEIDVEAESVPVLIVQVKYRPALWRITVNGAPVRGTAADAVWTAVSLTAGRSRVVMAPRIPAPVWLASLGAVIISALLGVVGRRR